MNLTLAVSAVAALGFTACSTMNAPLSSDGFDPLAPAGGGSLRNSPQTIAETGFSPGQFVRTVMDQTAFFSKRPSGNGDADKLLKKDVQMKVISADASYVKVELDSGEVGFVPTVLVNDAAQPVAGSEVTAGEFGVIPMDPNAPLPIIDPSSLPPGDAVPAVIDPEAPSVAPAAATTTPTTIVPGAAAPGTNPPLTPLSGIVPPAPSAPTPAPATEQKSSEEKAPETE
jgi:hypothetical protein